MRPRALIGLVVYVVLLAVQAVPEYRGALFGREWLLVVTVGVGTLGMATAVARWWALPVAVVGFAVLVLTSDPEALDYVALVVGVPLMVALAAIGWLVGRLLGVPAAVVLLLVAAVPAALAVQELVRRGERVSASLRAQLPLDVSLANLCSSTGPGEAKRLRRQTERLIVELRRRPGDVVSYWDGEQTFDISLRQLGEHRLDDLDGCAPALRRRLRAALD